MPIYEYTCQKCKKHIEIMQKVTDKPLARHSGCGGKLEKQWSQTSFQLKGSGWYVTDYAGKKSDGKDASETKAGEVETKGEPAASRSDKPASASGTEKTKEKAPPKASTGKPTKGGGATSGD